MNIKTLWTKYCYFFGILAVCIIGLSIYKFTSPSLNVEGEKCKSMAAVKAVRANLSQKVKLTAELHPYSQSTLYAKVTGYLKKIMVDIGDEVAADQILAVLDTPELDAELEKNKANFELAEIELKRINAVFEKHPGLLAQDEIDKIHTAFDVAKANYEHAKTMKGYSNITSPFNGIITKRFVDEGSLIQAGSNKTQTVPVVEIVDNTKLRIMFPVPESAAMQVKVGNPAEITIQSTTEKIKSTITRIAKNVERSTRTMDVEVDIDNKEKKLIPGMYASVNVPLNQKDNVVALPIQAVDMSDKPNVWIVNGQGKAEKRSVTLGLVTAEMAEITEGVKEGDIVLFGNLKEITPDLKIKPKLMDLSKTSEKKSET